MEQECVDPVTLGSYVPEGGCCEVPLLLHTAVWCCQQPSQVPGVQPWGAGGRTVNGMAPEACAWPSGVAAAFTVCSTVISRWTSPALVKSRFSLSNLEAPHFADSALHTPGRGSSTQLADMGAWKRSPDQSTSTPRRFTIAADGPRWAPVRIPGRPSSICTRNGV